MAKCWVKKVLPIGLGVVECAQTHSFPQASLEHTERHHAVQHLHARTHACPACLRCTTACLHAQATHGGIRLVDVSSEIPALKRMPGLHSWKVKDVRGRWFDSWAEAQAGGAYR